MKPDFDDARYRLALVENNTGDYAAAVAQLRAMKSIVPARAYAYWSALAYGLGELGRRGPAKAAADNALKYAATPDERAHAVQLAYTAQTDLAVQFTRDAKGRLQLETTRMPHGSREWNPFIEPGDTIRRARGVLREVECGGGKVTGVGVDTSSGRLRLGIPDPLHVLLRNGPGEFLCGAQDGRPVQVEYAVTAQSAAGDGVLRGLDFQ